MKSLFGNSEIGEALFIGAHCDDVEIGCGGTLHALAHARPQVKIHIAVFSGDPSRSAETREAIGKLLPNGQYSLDILGFRDGFFPHEWAQVKGGFEELKTRVTPDVVFTHYGDDKHQDHCILSELTWNTFRNQTILEYEIPKYDGDIGRPNMYVPLSADVVQTKVSALLESFPTQANKRWFTDDLFRGMMRIRGMECNSPSGYAEAFYARKFAMEW
ncbi:MAG TPA: PIG-L deacetylase family protein [Steroidobacteraceae bacterium]|nr:PIG-L deacetylase family protein [Steroidobacteraceae bacterium]